MNTTSVKSKSETRDRLLDAAMKLILSQGYTATTVDEICAEAGLTKGSFFYYFTDKEDLGRATAKHFTEFQQGMFDGADFRSLVDPLDRVYGRLNFILQMGRSSQMPKSCVIGNLAQEVSGTHEKIRLECQATFESSAADFERDVAAAKLKHAPKADFDPASIGRLYITVIQGSMVLAKAAKNPQVFVDNLEHLRRYLETLFGKRPSKKN